MGVVNYALHIPTTGNIIDVLWASLSTGSGSADSGQWFPSSLDYGFVGSLFSDKSVQVVQKGTGATDAQIIIQGCNFANVVDPTLYTAATLTDAQGNALIFAPTGTNIYRIEQILENTWAIRPLISTVSSTSMAVDVHLLLTSVRPFRSGM